MAPLVFRARKVAKWSTGVLIASVLTDRYGNFNVRLDTGYYKCVVHYDGYESETRMVRVKADEKVDFAVIEAKDGSKRRPASGSAVTRSNVRPMRHHDAS